MTVVPAMPFAEYHALDRLSAGRINALMESPAIYHGIADPKVAFDALRTLMG